MAFTVRRNDDLNTNERMIAFYKKELWASHIIETKKRQIHYNTKYYRKVYKADFPSGKRYRRIKAIVWNAYRMNKKKYTVLSQLWKSL